MKTQDPEREANTDCIPGDRIFAACFKAVFFALAIADAALEWVCRNLKRP